jgi:hypothetical protein
MLGLPLDLHFDGSGQDDVLDVVENGVILHLANRAKSGLDLGVHLLH